MTGLLLFAILAIVRVSHSLLGKQATPGSSSSWADGSEPAVPARVHPSPDERLADLVDRKTGIAASAAAEHLGLTPTALASVIERLELRGRIVARDGALYRHPDRTSA